MLTTNVRVMLLTCISLLNGMDNGERVLPLKKTEAENYKYFVFNKIRVEKKLTKKKCEISAERMDVFGSNENIGGRRQDFPVAIKAIQFTTNSGHGILYL